MGKKNRTKHSPAFKVKVAPLALHYFRIVRAYRRYSLASTHSYIQTHPIISLQALGQAAAVADHTVVTRLALHYFRIVLS